MGFLSSIIGGSKKMKSVPPSAGAAAADTQRAQTAPLIGARVRDVMPTLGQAPGQTMQQLLTEQPELLSFMEQFFPSESNISGALAPLLAEGGGYRGEAADMFRELSAFQAPTTPEAATEATIRAVLPGLMRSFREDISPTLDQILTSTGAASGGRATNIRTRALERGVNQPLVEAATMASVNQSNANQQMMLQALMASGGGMSNLSGQLPAFMQMISQAGNLDQTFKAAQLAAQFGGLTRQDPLLANMAGITLNQPEAQTTFMPRAPGRSLLGVAKDVAGVAGGFGAAAGGFAKLFNPAPNMTII